MGGFGKPKAWGVTSALRVASVVLAWAFSSTAVAQQASEKPVLVGNNNKPVVREIYVPAERLSVLLENSPEHLYLTRDEYAELVEKAAVRPASEAPLAITVSDAEYQIQIEENRARITGKLAVEVLRTGWHALPLALQGAGLRDARWDGQPALFARDEQGQTVLIAGGPGMHLLELECTAPVQTQAAQQKLQLQLPGSRSVRVTLRATGDIELQSGARVVSRNYDPTNDQTQFELVAPGGPWTFVLSVNNRILQRDRLVVSRGVVVDRLLHGRELVRVSQHFSVLHGVVDRLDWRLPADLNVQQVRCEQLARWEVSSPEGEWKRLTVFLRSPTSEPLTVQLTAERPLVENQRWEFPRVVPLDTAGSAQVVAILLEWPLELADLDYRGLTPIDAVIGQQLVESLPAGTALFPVRPIAAFYAPASDYAASGKVRLPPPVLDVRSAVTLHVDRRVLRAAGVFSVRQQRDRLFGFSFRVPAGWHVTQLTDAAGKVVEHEAFALPDGDTRIFLKPARVVEAGETLSVTFSAIGNIPEWLEEWERQQLSFPLFVVENAMEQRGAIAVLADDSLEVRLEELEGLSPLDRVEREEFGVLTEAPLAFRFESPDFRAVLAVARRQPELAARCYSFFRIENAGLVAHQEIVYTVRQAPTRRLSFALPKNTPGEIAVRGAGPVTVREYSARETETERIWDVTLAEEISLDPQLRAGQAQLLIDWQMPMPQTAEDIPLPIVRAAGTPVQAGYFAVESDLEREVSVHTGARRADLEELVEAQYRPGGRVAGAYAYSGPPAEARLSVRRYATYGLPAAVVERLELKSVVSTSGVVQTLAVYRLRTKLSTLELHLPDDAQTLWAVSADQQPISPFQHGDSVLLNLPVASQEEARVVSIAYESKVEPLERQRRFSLGVPTLWMPSEPGDTEAKLIPANDVQWELLEPPGYSVTRVDGTFAWRAPKRRWLAWFSLGKSSARPPTAAEPVPLWFAAPDAAGGFEGFAGAAAGGERMPALQENADQSVPVPEAPQNAVPQRGVTAGPPSIEGRPTSQTASGKAASKADALRGVRSLVIDVQAAFLTAPQDRIVRLQGLAAEPRARITVWKQHHANALMAGCAGLVLTMGLFLLRHGKQRWQFLAIVLGTALAVPQLLGMSTELWPAAAGVFVATAIVAVWEVAATAARLAGRWLAWGMRWLLPARSTRRPGIAHLWLALLLLPAGHAALWAQSPVPDRSLLDELQHLVTPPLKLPDDAVIIPYDSEQLPRLDRAERILVPYATYVKLWNRAYPDRPIQAAALPAEVALGPAKFRADLRDEDTLRMEADLSFYSLVDKPTSVTLPFDGMVLGEAAQGSPTARWEIAAPAAERSPHPNGGSLLVHLSGKGMHRVTFTLYFRVERVGGWRVVTGVLPAPVTSSLQCVVHEAPSEIRISGVADRTAWDIATAGDTIDTSLVPGARLRLQWRPKTGSVPVDTALTTTSQAVLDVLEDGLRLAWQSHLEFRQGRRDEFTFLLPAGYLVERVSGANVRGWNQVVEGDQTRLRVELLRTATESEQVLLYLSQRWTLPDDAPREFLVPSVQVEGASMQQGRLLVRRSVLVDLQLLEADGVTRADVDPEAADQLVQQAGNEERLLRVKAFQGFQFSRLPYRLRVRAAWLQPELRSQQQGVLRVSERQWKWQTRFVIQHRGMPVHQLKFRLPAGLEIAEVSQPEWVITKQDSHQLLTVYFGSGQVDQVVVELTGSAVPRQAEDPIELPVIHVSGASEEKSQWVVQADPAFRLQVIELRGGEVIPLEQTSSWFSSGAPIVAGGGLALSFGTGEYAARLAVARRQPVVRCVTLSNVSFTEQAIEETVLLEWQVLEAGINELVFRLPSRFQEARLDVPALRGTSVIPVAAAADAQPQVEFRVQLQDDLLGTIRLVAKLDLPLADQAHSAPIPVVLTGEVTRQYVTVQNSGRDELVVVEQAEVDGLVWGQTPWRDLVQLDVAYGFQVRSGAVSPRVLLRLQPQSQLQTVTARLGYAETIIVVDASGEYRARHEWRVENRTEQFLKVELPAEAALWAVHVAGQPVKPAQPDQTSATGQIWIPLVKTDDADADYPVILVYAGRLALPAQAGTVSFPLPRSTNIHTEIHQVTVYLPENYHWFDFRGAAPLQGEEEYGSAYTRYLQEQVSRLTQAFQSKSHYKKMRALQSLKIIESEVAQDEQSIRQRSVKGGDALALIQQAQQQIVEQLPAADAESLGQLQNRQMIERLYSEQLGFRAKNTVTRGEIDFGRSAGIPASGATGAPMINERWFASNLSAASGEPSRQQSRDLPSDSPQPQKAARDDERLRALNLELQADLGQARRPGTTGKPQAAAAPGGFAGGTVPQAAQPPASAAGEAAQAAGTLTAPSVSESRGQLAAGSPIRRGMASLELEIPQRGQVYYLRGERGRVEITARVVQRELSERSIRTAAGLILLAVGCWLVTRRRRTSAASTAS
ncbi:MAG: hypothetical protein KatS3mg109_0937 [Pirellulaceae bacterium]|nr:MAG: hypothetical protein KatS3mg109_0937 [Pirellulaceae bacterium]